MKMLPMLLGRLAWYTREKRFAAVQCLPILMYVIAYISNKIVTRNWNFMAFVKNMTIGNS